MHAYAQTLVNQMLLPLTDSEDLSMVCFLVQDRAPRCVSLSHTLLKRGPPALRAPQHEQMFMKVKEKNNIWNS